jgi:cytochrome c556
MNNAVKRPVITFCTVLAVALSPLAISHFDDKEPLQSYRQSYFAMTAMNFGPMAAMVKGEAPWDAEKFAGYAKDLSAISTLNVERGFAPGSDQGKTRAKPEIWENMDDFTAKLSNFREAVATLDTAAASGDADAMKAAFGATGKSCKACHDEYKSKDYIY